MKHSVGKKKRFSWGSWHDFGNPVSWKAKCPIFEAIVAGFRVKLPKKIGHLAFQVPVGDPCLDRGPPRKPKIPSLGGEWWLT